MHDVTSVTQEVKRGVLVTQGVTPQIKGNSRLVSQRDFKRLRELQNMCPWKNLENRKASNSIPIRSACEEHAEIEFRGGLFCIILFGSFLSYMRPENVWLVSHSAVMAAITEITKSEEDALVSCLVVFSVQTEKKSKYEIISACS